MSCASLVLMWGMPVFISIVTFGTFSVILHHDLTPAIVFTSLALFQLIQMPMRMVTSIFTVLLQSKVAMDRIDSFMGMPELDSENVLTIEHPSAQGYISKNVIISVEKGDFGWGDHDDALLRDVNLQVRTGDFVVLHGKVGCGKSSLCSALLGEMTKLKGKVFVGGSVAYCSQQPWIQNMTVRENILFGRPYEFQKYQKVIDACALTADLASLPAGDQTEIGERGVNVSGGQKARIALARACYSDASVYILDSPLSAVDAIVQNEMFQKCLLGLLRHKTILLVTHSPEIITSKHITASIMINETNTLVETRYAESSDATFQSIVSPLVAYEYCARTFVDKDVILEETTSISMEKKPEINSNDDKSMGKLVADEERSEGRVSSHVFIAYYHAVGGFWVVLLIVLSQAVWQGLQISSDFWLSNWASDSVADQKAASNTEFRLGVYSILGLASASMVALRTLMITFYGLRAAKNLFDRMTKALMHAPMKFFDSNPIGRILTRYGGDISAVDSQLPSSFGSLFALVFSVGCTVSTAGIVIKWKGLLLIPVMYLYAKIGLFYIEPARDIRRLSKTTQAPILTHPSESIDGGSIVRAFGSHQLRRFHAINNDRLDENNKIWFAQLCVSQWLSIRIQLIGSVLLLVIASSLVLLRNELSAAVIGLTFSYGLKVSQNLESIVQVMMHMEAAMISPERIQEYIDIPRNLHTGFRAWIRLPIQLGRLPVQSRSRRSAFVTRRMIVWC